MTVKACRDSNNSAASYIADLTTELAAIAAAEGHQYLARILHMAQREAQVLSGGGDRDGAASPLVSRAGRVH